MTTVIINRQGESVLIDEKLYIFRSFSKNNNGIVPTYVLHVNDTMMNNIKITLPQCNTIIIDIPKKKE